MTDTDGLICAFLLDGAGGGRAMEWTEIRSWTAERGTLWIHLDRTRSAARHWLQSQALIDPLISEALLAEETRPRTLAVGDSLLVILRGVNLNPGAEPEDMVSLRMWIDQRRIISLRFRRLMAIEDVRASIVAGNGPKGPSDFLATVAGRLIERMSSIIDTLDDEIDALEEAVLDAETHELRGRLANLRRRTITLRRHIAPQREAMFRLYGEPLAWLSGADRARLREVTDRITRYVEDLDAARERAAVTQEELSNRVAAQMNRTMYVLSLVAAIFLPLGLITGLLGINVGGIPGSENKMAFYIVTLMLAGLAALLVWIFRLKKWL